jgi:hypothetical protein
MTATDRDGAEEGLDPAAGIPFALISGPVPDLLP